MDADPSCSLSDHPDLRTLDDLAGSLGLRSVNTWTVDYSLPTRSSSTSPPGSLVLHSVSPDDYCCLLDGTAGWSYSFLRNKNKYKKH